MGVDSKSVHIFIAEIEVSESMYNEFENSWYYIEQDLTQLKIRVQSWCN